MSHTDSSAGRTVVRIAEPDLIGFATVQVNSATVQANSAIVQANSAIVQANSEIGAVLSSTR